MNAKGMTAYVVALRTQIAWHEAGHVVAGLLVDCGLEQAYIHQTKRRIDGWTSHSRLLRSGMSDRQMAMLGFGGLVGELLCEAVTGIPVESPRRPTSKTDLPFIRKFGDQEADEILEETKSLLSKHDLAIEWIANWLVKQDSIIANDIVDYMPKVCLTDALDRGLAVQRELFESVETAFDQLRKAMAEHPELCSLTAVSE